MKLIFTTLFFMLLADFSVAKTIKVAVIDTGYTKQENVEPPKFCGNHIDLTGSGVIDNIGHGTNIMLLIHRYAKESNYCIIPIKFLHSYGGKVKNVEAFKKAHDLEADIIVFAAGGPSIEYNESYWIAKSYIDNNALVIVAAGNRNKMLGKPAIKLTKENCDYFPACAYDKVVVVGNGKSAKEPSESSNYGPVVDIWEDGENKTTGSITLTGSSQATAIVVGKFLQYYGTKEKSNDRQNLHESKKKFLRDIFLEWKNRKSIVSKHPNNKGVRKTKSEVK